jgi:septal ring factor EnvC (AmiA/AmiB activator)
MRKMTRRFLPLILAISVVVLLFAWIQLRLHLHVVEQRADSLESTFMGERSYIEQLRSANASFRGKSSELEEVVDTLGGDLKEQMKANAALRDKIRLMLGSEIEAQANKIHQQKEIKRLRKDLQQLRDKQPPPD